MSEGPHERRGTAPASTVRLVERLVQRFPVFRASYDDHVDTYEEVLPHVYFDDVTREVIADYLGADTGLWQEVIAFLERELESTTDHDVREVIELSFAGDLPYPDEPGDGIERHLGPYLMASYHRQHPPQD